MENRKSKPVHAEPFPILLAGGAWGCATVGSKSLPACRGTLLSRGEAKAHQRRAGGVSDANDGRHPLKRSGSGMPLGAVGKPCVYESFPLVLMSIKILVIR